MNPLFYELYFREVHKARLAEAASDRLTKLANKKNSESTRRFSRIIADVLQKVGLKFAGIYYSLYQKSKSHIALHR